MANSACSIPSGNGGARGASLTACLAGTGMAVSRPGRASASAGMRDLLLENIAAPRDHLVGPCGATLGTSVAEGCGQPKAPPVLGYPPGRGPLGGGAGSGTPL